MLVPHPKWFPVMFILGVWGLGFRGCAMNIVSLNRGDPI